MLKQTAIIIGICLISYSTMALSLSSRESGVNVASKAQVSGLEKIKNPPKIYYRTETDLSEKSTNVSETLMETYLTRYQSASLSFLELRLKQVEQSIRNLSQIQTEKTTTLQNLLSEKAALEQLITQRKNEQADIVEISDQADKKQ